MKTKIYQSGCGVILESDIMSTSYYVRRGYVYDGNDNQVCARLDRLGSTLYLTDSNDLLKLIRQEWRKFKRDHDKYAAC